MSEKLEAVPMVSVQELKELKKEIDDMDLPQLLNKLIEIENQASYHLADAAVLKIHVYSVFKRLVPLADTPEKQAEMTELTKNLSPKQSKIFSQVYGLVYCAQRFRDVVATPPSNTPQ